jgi:hypothetical protein
MTQQRQLYCVWCGWVAHTHVHERRPLPPALVRAMEQDRQARAEEQHWIDVFKMR